MRRSARRLTAEQLALLRQAFGAAMEISDERGYNYFAGIHGLPRPIGCDNAHGTPYFLPWHRAYLYFFERSLRDRVRDASLVWWDWRVHDIPDVFAQESDPDRQANPLLSAAVDPLALEQGRRARPPIEMEPNTVRQPGEPPPLPTKQEVTRIMRLGDFGDFSQAAEGLHDRVHGWV